MSAPTLEAMREAVKLLEGSVSLDRAHYYFVGDEATALRVIRHEQADPRDVLVTTVIKIEPGHYIRSKKIPLNPKPEAGGSLSAWPGIDIRPNDKIGGQRSA